MFIVLSQKIDTDSPYSDELYHTYHFPARYKNQIHTGDKFVYYQGNRYKKEQRYYFGSGIVGRIYTTDEESYYAELRECFEFRDKVSIYLNDGGYIEQKGYKNVRNSPNPPWQSSIRPISAEAFSFIISRAGQNKQEKTTTDIEQQKKELKRAIKAFYIGGDNNAILTVLKISKEIAAEFELEPFTSAESSKANDETDMAKKALFDYCKSMRMTYSYKPILIMALLDKGTVDGEISINTAASFFRDFYKARRDSGLKIEKGNCVYNDLFVREEVIAENIIKNPVKALVSSGYFDFDAKSRKFRLKPELWVTLSHSDKIELQYYCANKLENYYSSK